MWARRDTRLVSGPQPSRTVPRGSLEGATGPTLPTGPTYPALVATFSQQPEASQQSALGIISDRNLTKSNIKWPCSKDDAHGRAKPMQETGRQEEATSKALGIAKAVLS